MAGAKDEKAIFARVTPAERERLEEAARAEGFRSFAEWVRQTLFKRADEVLAEKTEGSE